MSDDLRNRIAAVQASHHHWDYAGALTCACGEDFGVDNAGWEAAVTDWAQHVADAVIRELEADYVYIPRPASEVYPEPVFPTDEAEQVSLQGRLDCIGRWMHPGLWSGLDSRREAILKILKVEMVEPPSWGTPSFDNGSRDD